MTSQNSVKIHQNAASKKPLAPLSGAYASLFEAKHGLERLISSQSKTRQDITAVLKAASNPDYLRNEEVATLALKVASLLKSPENEEEIMLMTNLISYGISSLGSLSKLAFEDPTGYMAAAVMMNAATPEGLVNSITANWNFKANPIGDENIKRGSLLNRIINLTNYEIHFDNIYGIAKVIGIIRKEGWNSTFSTRFIKGCHYVPAELLEFAKNNAPTNIVKDIRFKSIYHHTDAGQFQEALDSFHNFASIQEMSNVVVHFMNNDKVPNSEKIKFYSILSPPSDSSIPIPACNAGAKAFASIKSQETFDVALTDFLNGTGNVIVKELTANYDYSLIEYKRILDIIERNGLFEFADPGFLQAARTLEGKFHNLENPETTDFDIDENDSLELSSSTYLPIIHLSMQRTPTSPERYLAIMTAAIMISIGVPVSIALNRTYTTPNEIVSNPDILKKGKTLAQTKSFSDELEEKMQEAYSTAYEQVHLPPPLPRKDYPAPSVAQTPKTNTVAKKTTEITPSLVDVVISLEHVKGKTYSYKGAAGQMQLMPETWEQINQKYFKGRYPFEKYASNAWINRRFGTIYLQVIKNYLDSHKNEWKTDQVPLLLACYHGGINNIMRADFDPRKIKQHFPATYDYMIRGANLMGYDTRYI